MRKCDLGWRERRQIVVCGTENHDFGISVMLQLLSNIGGEIDQDFGGISCVFASCVMVNLVVVISPRENGPLHSTTDVKGLRTV